MVHLHGDLVQPAVPQHPRMLADGAPHLDPAVLRLTHVVRCGKHNGVSIVLLAILAREAEHQGVRAGEMGVSFDRIHQKARRSLSRARMIRIY